MPSEVFEEYWNMRLQAAHLRLLAALKIIEHNPSRGTSAENLLKSLVLEFLPDKWSIGSGFVVNNTSKISKQLDILIYDAMTTSAIYRDGEFVVLPTGTAAVAIEVKSNLNQKEVNAAMDNAVSVKSIDRNVVHLTFAYKSDKPETIAKHLRSKLKLLRGSKSFDPMTLPDRFYALDRGLVVTRSRKAGADTYRGFIDYKDKPIIRFLFTQLLSTLKLRNLQAFIDADDTRSEAFRVK